MSRNGEPFASLFRVTVLLLKKLPKIDVYQIVVPLEDIKNDSLPDAYIFEIFILPANIAFVMLELGINYVQFVSHYTTLLAELLKNELIDELGLTFNIGISPSERFNLLYVIYVFGIYAKSIAPVNFVKARLFTIVFVISFAFIN